MNQPPRSAPPAFIPTLTEVVRADFAALPAEFAKLLEGWPTAGNAAQSSVTEAARADMNPLAPALLERLLLRVELSLASQLQETVERALEVQMSALKQSLRAQISATVLQAINQAVLQETASQPTDLPQR